LIDAESSSSAVFVTETQVLFSPPCGISGFRGNNHALNFGDATHVVASPQPGSGSLLAQAVIAMTLALALLHPP
jgi:hypothetical protein